MTAAQAVNAAGSDPDPLSIVIATKDPLQGRSRSAQWLKKWLAHKLTVRQASLRMHLPI